MVDVEKSEMVDGLYADQWTALQDTVERTSGLTPAGRHLRAGTVKNLTQAQMQFMVAHAAVQPEYLLKLLDLHLVGADLSTTSRLRYRLAEMADLPGGNLWHQAPDVLGRLFAEIERDNGAPIQWWATKVHTDMSQDTLDAAIRGGVASKEWVAQKRVPTPAQSDPNRNAARNINVAGGGRSRTAAEPVRPRSLRASVAANPDIPAELLAVLAARPLQSSVRRRPAHSTGHAV